MPPEINELPPLIPNLDCEPERRISAQTTEHESPPLQQTPEAEPIDHFRRTMIQAPIITAVANAALQTASVTAALFGPLFARMDRIEAAELAELAARMWDEIQATPKTPSSKDLKGKTVKDWFEALYEKYLIVSNHGNQLKNPELIGLARVNDVDSKNDPEGFEEIDQEIQAGEHISLYFPVSIPKGFEENGVTVRWQRNGQEYQGNNRSLQEKRYEVKPSFRYRLHIETHFGKEDTGQWTMIISSNGHLLHRQSFTVVTKK